MEKKIYYKAANFPIQMQLKKLFKVFLLISCVLIFPFQLVQATNQAPTGAPTPALYPQEPIVPQYQPTQGVIDSNGNEILYWVQLADIHVNLGYEDILQKFDEVCDAINSTIKPAFVISTGDNVDGVGNGWFGAYVQDEAEYIHYNETLAKYGFDSSFWLAAPGNHDTYGTGLNQSLWETYIRNETQYAVDYATDFGVYRFILVDSTQDYGLNSILGLFGEAKTEKLDHLEALVNYENEANPNGIDEIIFAAHHPSNNIISQRSSSGLTFKELLVDSNAQIYLVGHLHEEDLFQNHGSFTEIHGPSLKNNYRYKICAYDHGLFSFSDETIGEWPAVVVTNPTDARFYNTNMDLEIMKDQSEIRTLIFDENPITSAYVSINGEIIGNLTQSDGNLWVASWNPANYLEGDGRHHLKVYVESESGSTVRELEFSLTDFTPSELDSFFVWYFFTLPIFRIWIGVLVLLILFALLKIFIPKWYFATNAEKFENRTPASFDQPDSSFFEKHFVKRWFQAASLTRKEIALLIIPWAYYLVGPVIIGVLGPPGVIGTAWIYGTFIEGVHVLEFMPVIIFLLYMAFYQGFENYVVRAKDNKMGAGARISLLPYFFYVGYFIVVCASYFGLISVFITPTVYLMIGIPLYMIYKIERNQKRLRS